MTDDICGAECADGSACQHPADACPVASHSDSTADNSGRPSKFSTYKAQDAVAAARSGKSERGVERAVGVGERTIFGPDGWVSQGHTYIDAAGNKRDFSRALRRARSSGEDKWIQEGQGEDGDSSFAKFMLSTSYDYTKTEKREVDASHEHTGEGGGPVEIAINETVVETGHGDDE